MAIEIKNVTHTYMKKTPYEKAALQNVSLTIEEGSFTAVAGHTGSGKSTLMQHLNGLLQPDSGTVLVDGVDVNKKKDKAALAARRKVGLVFQYPEQQLFEETVYSDIAFGPRNFGLNEADVKERVQEAMDFVELSYEKYKDKSPFQLSGGQKRRAALAGIIALKPRYLVLDEPTAGLDPRLKRSILTKIKELNEKEHTTIIMVSHNMDDIAFLAQKVAVLNHGRLMICDEPQKVFGHEQILKEAGLLEPEVMQLMQAVKQAGLDVRTNVLTREAAFEEICTALRKRGIKC